MPPPTSIEDSLQASLEDLQASGLHRHLKRLTPLDGARVRAPDGRELLCFCSNDYLGLAQHPEVVEAAVRATRDYGAGVGASRLVSGHRPLHERLEERIAEWKGLPAALLTSSGYQANIGTIAALVDHRDVIFSDELNHASIVDGCRLARARTVVFRHNDTGHLAELLAHHASARRKLIITESVFSMDGDIAPLADLVQIKKAAGAWLMIDEAHGVGTFGPNGAGVASALGLGAEIDCHIGTLGKALGSFGAYVAGSRELIEFLINRSRAFIFTTGSTPATAAAALQAIEICCREPERRMRPGRMAAQMAAQMAERSGMLAADAATSLRPIPAPTRSVVSQATRAADTGAQTKSTSLTETTHSPILPVVLGSAARAVAMADALWQQGFYVGAIRPPTVPEGTSRLRVTFSADHTEQQTTDLAEALRAVLEEVAD